MPRDYYEILEIPPDASDDEVREAYREKAREYHPDTSDHENAREVFKEIKEAYEVLSNDEKREEYDSEQGPRWGKTEIDQKFDTGWVLAYQESASDGKRWMVVGNTREGKRYINQNGDLQEEEFYFDSRIKAKRSYSDYAGGLLGEDGEFKGKRGDRKWSEIQGVNRFDTGWSLGYQQDLNTGEKRWVIYVKEGGGTKYLHRRGIKKNDPYWFPSREKAKEAHGNYLGKGGGKVGSWSDRSVVEHYERGWSLGKERNPATGDTRWAIFSSAEGNTKFINERAQVQRKPHWFDTQEEARNTYGRYVKRLTGEEEKGGILARVGGWIKGILS